MNHMISDDNGESSYSPHFKGDICIHCGRHEDVNEKGECGICSTGKCFLCEETVSNKSLKSVKDKLVCADCIDYNGIDSVRELILRLNLKAERAKRIEMEKKLKEINHKHLLIHS